VGRRAGAPSRLITNAADASAALPEHPPITLRLLASERSLIIEAWDHSPRDLEPGEADADAECGHGLTVVAALSDRWGWERTGHHRKVGWAELALRAGCRSIQCRDRPRFPHSTTTLFALEHRGQGRTS
jgi:hypothetical protein